MYENLFVLIAGGFAEVREGRCGQDGLVLVLPLYQLDQVLIWARECAVCVWLDESVTLYLH